MVQIGIAENSTQQLGTILLLIIIIMYYDYIFTYIFHTFKLPYTWAMDLEKLRALTVGLGKVPNPSSGGGSQILGLWDAPEKRHETCQYASNPHFVSIPSHHKRRARRPVIFWE